ncbi:MAG TPA: hypothetical protein VGR29_04400 [Thermomicrobiales bacterium]|nr:hypothetical protein [Thermomicrobiales bacterium]
MGSVVRFIEGGDAEIVDANKLNTPVDDPPSGRGVDTNERGIERPRARTVPGAGVSRFQQWVSDAPGNVGLLQIGSCNDIDSFGDASDVAPARPACDRNLLETLPVLQIVPVRINMGARMGTKRNDARVEFIVGDRRVRFESNIGISRLCEGAGLDGQCNVVDAWCAHSLYRFPPILPTIL